MIVEKLYRTIVSTSKESLDSAILDRYLNMRVESGVPNEWFFHPAGKEHYRLLIRISELLEGSNIIDVGTYEGSSSLALADNNSNHVFSFDINKNHNVSKITKSNISFIVSDCTSNDYKAKILSSPFILLDTAHDGLFENIFYKYLLDIKYRGVLMLDDIRLNRHMIDFWNSIKLEKQEITQIGHYTGTGLVWFNY